MTPTPPILRVRGATIPVPGTLVMGVVNASPESFSDGGRVTTLDARLDVAAEIIEAGADIVDVGGQSAVTNQPELDAGLEAERVLPVVAWLRSFYPDVLISVDTYKPSVVDAVLDAGASIINDVSGLRYPEVASSCARHGAGLVVMHTAAAPKVRRQDPGLYGDITAEVTEFLADALERATLLGLPRESIIVDPGPDFTKTPSQTVELLRGIHAVRDLERPVLLALSRKDFLGAITGRAPRGRDAATFAAIAHFATVPGNIVRVHDVAGARDAIATVETLEGMRDLAPDLMLPDALRHEVGP